MKFCILLGAALAAAVPLGSAEADGMIEGGYRPDARRPALQGSGRYYVKRHAQRRYVGARRDHFGSAYGGEISPQYGAKPPFFPGAGGAAPDGPVLLAEYREPYIGRGLIYNVPPDPFYRSGYVVRAKY